MSRREAFDERSSRFHPFDLVDPLSPPEVAGPRHVVEQHGPVIGTIRHVQPPADHETAARDRRDGYTKTASETRHQLISARCDPAIAQHPAQEVNVSSVA